MLSGALQFYFAKPKANFLWFWHISIALKTRQRVKPNRREGLKRFLCMFHCVFHYFKNQLKSFKMLKIDNGFFGVRSTLNIFVKTLYSSFNELLFIQKLGQENYVYHWKNTYLYCCLFKGKTIMVNFWLDGA